MHIGVSPPALRARAPDVPEQLGGSCTGAGEGSRRALPVDGRARAGAGGDDVFAHAGAAVGGGGAGEGRGGGLGGDGPDGLGGNGGCGSGGEGGGDLRGEGAGGPAGDGGPRRRRPTWSLRRRTGRTGRDRSIRKSGAGAGDAPDDAGQRGIRASAQRAAVETPGSDRGGAGGGLGGGGGRDHSGARHPARACSGPRSGSCLRSRRHHLRRRSPEPDRMEPPVPAPAPPRIGSRARAAGGGAWGAQNDRG